MFVHALDVDGRLVGQADGMLASGRLPTSVLEAGDRVMDVRRVSLDAEGSATRALVGLYRAPDGPRLPRVGVAGDSATITFGEALSCR